MRPDGHYGLSKAFGENLSRFYFDRYGIETVCLRIGSSFPAPKDRRMLATYLSYDDLERLVVAALTAPRRRPQRRLRRLRQRAHVVGQHLGAPPGLSAAGQLGAVSRRASRRASRRSTRAIRPPVSRAAASSSRDLSNDQGDLAMNMRRTLVASFLRSGDRCARSPPGRSPPRRQSMTLKAADVHPAGYPNVVAIEHLGQKLEPPTNGRIKLKMFASGVLGGEKEMIEQTQVGAIDILRTSLGPIGPVVPDVNVFNMPFVFRNEAAHARRDRRADRRRDARQDHRLARQARRPRLDGRRLAQPLHQEARAHDR